LALLATPFLLLAALGTALWVVAPHRNLGDILETARAASLLGVGALDWFVDAF
jgi:hypothetical protein